MKTKSVRHWMPLGVLLCVIAFSGTAQAGPPLLCRPFEIGGAPSLPWNGPAWRDVRPDYDINRLVDDTMALLTPRTPVLARMETLRRATVYAAWSLVDSKTGYSARDPKIARELISRLERRAAEAKGKGGDTEALALFDVGYLAESYKQASVNAGIDGLASVVKAIGLGGNSAEMEFAAAVITIESRNASQRDHLRKAVAGAADGSLLARNLVLHFSELGKSISELRTHLSR